MLRAMASLAQAYVEARTLFRGLGLSDHEARRALRAGAVLAKAGLTHHEIEKIARLYATGEINLGEERGHE